MSLTQNPSENLYQLCGRLASILEMTGFQRRKSGLKEDDSRPGCLLRSTDLHLETCLITGSDFRMIGQLLWLELR